MPLSDHEKRMLQEMEAALLTEDPRLFSALSGTGPSPKRPRILASLGLVLMGITVLFTGLIAKVTPVGVLGFAIALAGIILALSSFGGSSSGSTTKSARKSKGLNSKLQSRWDDRNNQ
ncbi:MAG: DUF3040 domain-containing protein [Candidatus Planktophila sp.]